MGKPRGHNWGGAPTERLERMQEARRNEVINAQKILSARTLATQQSPLQINRPGVANNTRTRYATTANPSDWVPVGGGRAIVDAVLNSIEDGADRIILTWPHRPGSGFAATAVTLREARTSGRLAHATLAFWPWRTGSTWAARSILVNPGDIAQAAGKIMTELRQSPAWAESTLAHESLCMLEMRLRDLLPENSSSQEKQEKNGKRIVVRNPSLLETTAVFIPNDKERGSSYEDDGSQILRRVRDYTHMGDKNAGLEEHIAGIGNPLRTPFSIFGIPALSQPEAYGRFLTYPRFTQHGLDAVVVDLTRAGRSELAENWETRFSVFLKALENIPGRKPAVVVLTEDAFTIRKASRIVRSHKGSSVQRRETLEVGAYLQSPGLFGAVTDIPDELPSLPFEADIKDASLADLRGQLLTLGNSLRKTGDGLAAEGVSKALTFLRRAASLPLGLRETREIVDILYAGEEEGEIPAKAMFRPKMALAPFAMIANLAPSYTTEVQRLLARIEDKIASWENETPVSLKLASILNQTDWNIPSTLVAVPDKHIADVFMSSDRGVNWQCDIADHKRMLSQAEILPKKIIVIGPTSNAVRALLTTRHSFERVLLLGDAAGSALLAAEIAPLAKIEAFKSLATRAKALAAALERGGGDETLDVAESEFRISTLSREGEIDFTKAGEAYRGEIIRFRTSQEHKVAYRPNSDVLKFSASEIRPFERIQAQQLRIGDRILVLNADVRESIRRAIAGSGKSLAQLTSYHQHIAAIREKTPGTTYSYKARHILNEMRNIDPAVQDGEIQNILRWLKADLAPSLMDGAKQPRAPRNWSRFLLFMRAVGVDAPLAKIYWDAAIVPTRSYRVQEGYLFNQRVVQFVLDPEGVTLGKAIFESVPKLWQRVVDAVDEIVDIKVTTAGEEHG